MKKYTVQLDIAFLSLIIIPYFLFAIGTMPLHTPDEARYSLISVEMLKQQQYLIPQLFGAPFLDKPPLFYYVQIFMVKLFGLSEFSLRLPSVVCAWASCIMIYYTSYRFFSRAIAWQASLILMNMPLFFAMAHYANLDMMVASFITCALCTFLLAQAADIQKTRPLMWLTYAMMALAMLSKGLIALALPIGSIGIYCVFNKIKPRLFLLEGVLIFCVAVVPWFWMMHNAIQGFSYYYFVIQHFFRYLNAGLNNPQPIWFYFAIVGLCALPWLIMLLPNLITALKPKQKETEKNKALNFFAIAFVFILVFFSIPNSKTLGYILPTLPLLSVLLAVFINRGDLQNRFLALAIISIIGGLSLCYPWHLLRPYQHEVMPFALILTVSGCCGLLIRLLTASPQQITPNKRQQYAFISLIITTMMLLNVKGYQLVQTLEFQTIQPIVRYLKSHDKNKLPIIMYQEMYYDVGHYLSDRKVLLVNDWKKGLFKGDTIADQFALGLQARPSANHLNTKQFKRYMSDSKRGFYLVTNLSNANQLEKQGIKTLTSYKGIYLLYKQS